MSAQAWHVLLLGTALVTHATLAQDYPTNVKARLTQRNDLSKLKVGYNINTPESTHIWMCVNCDVDETGSRLSNKGFTTLGSTCGGYPHGCAVLKPFGWSPGDVVSLSFRVGDSLWSTEKIMFAIGDDVEQKPGMTHLERAEAKDEL